MEIPNPRIDDKRHRFIQNDMLRNVYLAFATRIAARVGAVVLGPASFPYPPGPTHGRSAILRIPMGGGRDGVRSHYNEEVLGDIEIFLSAYGYDFMAYANRNFYRIWDSGFVGPERFLESHQGTAAQAIRAARPRVFVFENHGPDRPPILRRELERHHPTLPKRRLEW